MNSEEVRLECSPKLVKGHSRVNCAHPPLMANIPPSGCNLTVPPREYHLHLINIPSHVRAETIHSSMDWYC